MAARNGIEQIWSPCESSVSAISPLTHSSVAALPSPVPLMNGKSEARVWSHANPSSLDALNQALATASALSMAPVSCCHVARSKSACAGGATPGPSEPAGTAPCSRSTSSTWPPSSAAYTAAHSASSL
eukprot:2120591-Prymnesium_polylepis.1